MDSPDQGVKGIRAEVQSAGEMAVELSVPRLAISYKGLLYRETLVGTFSQYGKDFPLSFRRGEEQLSRPQEPAGPFPYATEEVSFTNAEAGAVLRGTLSVPENAGPDTPVVLMVTGSGLENRDEEIFDHKPFLVIADHLARHGIASLRYDDRGFGASEGGDIRNATTLDYQQDAKCGTAFLRASGRFGRIGVLGHSEGANIAFMLGASSDADFVVSLAGVGVRGDEAFAAQANRVLELGGVDKRYTTEEYRNEVSAVSTPWMRWFMDYDPIEHIKACKCPVFAINGGKDIQVVASLNFPPIREVFSEGNSNFVKEYPNLNHLFQNCRTGTVEEYRLIEETISVEVLNDLTNWILNNIK
ncbi:MAG: alpha/beta hydrolase [Bacteroidales bacterium]|nr:alpha/beta hydrolase [Bacteroidales bacterium]